MSSSLVLPSSFESMVEEPVTHDHKDNITKIAQNITILSIDLLKVVVATNS